MDIQKYIRPGKNIVLELDDEVEYLLPDASVAAINRDSQQIELVRLYDGVHRLVALDRVRVAISNGGIVDYLDKV